MTRDRRSNRGPSQTISVKIIMQMCTGRRGIDYISHDYHSVMPEVAVAMSEFPSPMMITMKMKMMTEASTWMVATREPNAWCHHVGEGADEERRGVLSG